MLRNIKLIISYDGSNYFGWQKQNKLPTIQEEIEKALYNITGKNIDIIGSGRTDTNVHALAQVANFQTTSKIPAGRIKCALNANLSTDIRILSSEEVDLDFNSRFSAKRKTYLYQIYNDRVSSPFYEKYSYHIPYRLDINIMREALIKLEGEHDFKAFMSSNSSVKSTVRTIYDTAINSENKLIKIEIAGNGFLYNMVRIIVGTVIEIGNGKKDITCIEKAIQTGQRTYLGQTAKPQGLFLKEVVY